MSDDTKESLGRIEGKLDTFIAGAIRIEDHRQKLCTDHCLRTGSLEKSRERAYGAGKLLAWIFAVLTATGGAIWKILSYHGVKP